MEVAGLAIGAIGIAGLFSVCIDVLERFDAYADFGISSNQLSLRFEAEKLKLQEWAAAVGIEKTKLKKQHHSRLDELRVRTIVEGILLNITDLFASADQLSDRLRRMSVADTTKSQSTQRRMLIGRKPTKSPAPSSRNKVKWILGHESRFTKYVETLELLTEKLHQLVPPNNSGRTSASAAFTILDDTVHEFSVPYMLPAPGRVPRVVGNKIQTILEDQLLILVGELDTQYLQDQFERHITSKLSGTCNWIFENKEYQKWSSKAALSSTTKVFWLYGPADCGKTVVTSNIVSVLQAKDPFVFHFFTPINMQSTYTPKDIIRAWISEIAKVDQASFDFMLSGLSSKKDIAFLSSADLWHSFTNIVSHNRRCTFVLDGLDECDHHDPSYNLFLKNLLWHLRGTCSKVLLTTRDDPQIRLQLTSTATTSKALDFSWHCINHNDTLHDRTLYAKHIIEQQLPRKNISVQRQLASAILTRSNGNFLWMALLAKDFSVEMSKARLQHVVEDFPPGLDAAHARAWQKVLKQNEHDRARASRILEWSTYAIRPLTVSELSEALMLQSQDDRIGAIHLAPIDDIDEEYVNAEVKNICAGLINVRSLSASDALAQKTVQLTHYSVKEFLRTSAADPMAASTSDSMHHLELARVCLRYLYYMDSFFDGEAVGGNNEAHGFGIYALQNWTVHGNLSATDDSIFQDHAAEFLDSRSSRFSVWAGKYGMKVGLDSETSETIHSPSNPFLYAALLGLTTTMQKIHDRDATLLDAADPKVGTALQATCVQGHYPAFSMLLRLGANVNARGGKLGSALGAAAYNGRRLYLERLLKHGAKKDLKDDLGRTPFYLAARQGHSEILKLLYSDAKELNTTTSKGYTPVYAAAARGHLKTVQFLLQCSIDQSIYYPDGWTPLMVASSAGHEEVVKLLLNEGVDFATPSKHGWTPLNAAASKGHVKVVRLLLEHGANVQSVVDSNLAPLYLAAYKGHVEVVGLLLACHADLITTMDHAHSPLYAASNNGHIEVVKKLLDHGADAINLTYNGWTLLTAVCDSGYLEIVRLLLDHQADPNKSNDFGSTPIYSASYEGHLDVVDLLLERGADLGIADNDQWTPLNSASYNGHIEVVRLLLDRKADHTMPSVDGTTPLHSASSEGFIDIAKLLIERGASLGIADTDGLTPLSSASFNGHTDVVRLLLDCKADLDVRNIDGSTALKSSSVRGHTDVVKLLLERGADAGIADNNGWTPLNSASFNGHIEIVKLLLARGSSSEEHTDEGETALHVACRVGNLAIVKILLDHGADKEALTNLQQTCLYTACVNGHLETAQVLLDQGADIEAPDDDGFTPLCAASSKGHVKVVELLLERGAVVTTPNHKGWTALHTASNYGHLEIVRLLLQRGANTTAVINEKWTALNMASFAGHFQIVQLLLDYKADFTISTQSGHTPLMSASSAGHSEIVQLLLRRGADASEIKGSL